MTDHPVFDAAEHAVLHPVRTAEGWFGRDHDTSAAQPAATATIRTITPGGPVSQLSDTLHAIAARLERYDEETLAKLEAVRSSPVTAEVFDVAANLTHVNPSPEFSAIITLLKAFTVPAQQAEPSFTPAGPQVAGQA